MFWGGVDEVWRAALSALVLYAAIVAMLRISGKRTLSQLNLFDWLVTVAMGSMVATTVLSGEVAVAAGLAGIGTLMALQWAISFLEARKSRIDVVVKASPRLLVHRGELLHDAMREERISEREIMQALRQHGLPTPGRAAAVVLETNGGLSVIRDEDFDGADDALVHFEGFGEEREGA